MKPLVLSFLLFGAGLVLAGCGGTVVPNCPAAGILTDTATLTRFRPGAPADLSGEAYTAEITALKSDCSFDKTAGHTASSLAITVRATRAPSAEAATYTLPYYVAVSQGERLLSKKLFDLQISFAPGSAATSVDDTIERTEIQLETGHPPTDYQILVGFQLTETERAYAGTRNRYTP